MSRSTILYAGVFTFLLLIFISGCSPLYVLRAAYEEGKILWRRQPIAEMLQNSNLGPENREKLQLVLGMRDYARDTLKFRVDGSYASYSYVDRSALSYVFMAVPKTDLSPYTWWFLFVGRVSYKGFFSEEAAKAEAERFAARGYDTFIRTTPAFSTLGWFDDPLLAHLLRYDKVTLARVVFHELFHNTLFVKGSLDFNESLANFFGNRAAIHFFRDRYGERSPEHRLAEQAWQEELEFAAFITRSADSLRELYARDLPLEEKLRQREEIFAASKRAWAAQTAGRPQPCITFSISGSWSFSSPSTWSTERTWRGWLR
ncbi:MAG: aminopeptidase [Deltaproteobacteria bacterium]|nr:aminopeptidase [Deltaproteobacteria bacterium]